jgi:hypothetical protein
MVELERQKITAANTGLPSVRASPFASGGVIPFRASRDRLCKIEAEYSYQTFVQVDSEVLRNRQLRQHANRYKQLKECTRPTLLKTNELIWK